MVPNGILHNAQSNASSSFAALHLAVTEDGHLSGRIHVFYIPKAQLLTLFIRHYVIISASQERTCLCLSYQFSLLITSQRTKSGRRRRNRSKRGWRV